MALNANFDEWFDILQLSVRDRVGADFRARELVRPDFEAGRDVFDVIDDICAEYGDD